MRFEIDQAAGPRNRRMIRRRFWQLQSEKLAQRKGIRRAPRDGALCVQAFEVADQQQPKVSSRRPESDGLNEVVADKGYHSNQELVDLEAVGVRSYISEPDRGRRNWKDHPEARVAVYRNRRRIRGARGKRLLRQRGERLERPFARLYETGRMRRVYLRGHTNILKRVLLHTAALNLGLLMRTLCGVGTPRSLQGRVAALLCCAGFLIRLPETLWDVIWTMYHRRDSAP